MSDCTQPVSYTITLPSILIGKRKKLFYWRKTNQKIAILSVSLSLLIILGYKHNPKLLIIYMQNQLVIIFIFTIRNRFVKKKEKKKEVCVKDQLFLLSEKFNCICHLNCRQYIKEKYLLQFSREPLSKKKTERDKYISRYNFQRYSCVLFMK